MSQKNSFLNKLNLQLVTVLLLGFSSGLPFLLVGATLKAWLARAGIPLATVGLLALVKLPYNWKFVWSPLMDRYKLSVMGRRRSWMLLSQFGLVLSLLAFTQLEPQMHLQTMIIWAVVASFFSATQDIAIDAYRREILPVEQLGLGSSLNVFGYRLATMFASGGAFLLADQMSWQNVYAIMSAFMGVGILTVVLCPEPKQSSEAPRNLRASVVEPLTNFFAKPQALPVLGFVFLYKIGESMANEMYNPFFIQMGFTNIEIGSVTKIFAVWAMIVGGLLGGILLMRLKIYRALLYFGILQSVGLLLFTWLAHAGHNVTVLAIAIGFEYFTSGMATSAFVAFLASQTDSRYTAVQYSLLSSLGVAMPATLVGSLSGFVVEALGWPRYFIFCAILTLPGLALLKIIRRSVAFEPSQR